LKEIPKEEVKEILKEEEDLSKIGHLFLQFLLCCGCSSAEFLTGEGDPSVEGGPV
jgi:hypothetical protein